MLFVRSITLLIITVLITWIWRAASTAWVRIIRARAARRTYSVTTALFNNFLSLFFFRVGFVLFLELMLVFLSLIPHYKLVSFIHCNSHLVQFWLILSELLKESNREFFATFTSSKPNTIKVAYVNKILCNCNRQIQIEHAVPPIWWDEDCFSGILYAFDNIW